MAPSTWLERLMTLLFVICTANGAPMTSVPMKRLVENIVKSLPGKLDQELLDPPHVRFTSEPEDTILKEGDRKTLTCEAEGIPPPTVKWVVDGQDLANSNRDYSGNIVEKLLNVGKTTIQRGITVSKLHIDCASIDTEGVYSCIAENGHETIETSVRVSVEEGNSLMGCSRMKKAGMREAEMAPHIYMWTDGRVEMAGVNAQLYCRATGKPAPKIEWRRSDDSLVESSATGSFQILPSGDLLIRDADFDSLDSYTCVATNLYGEDTVDAFFYPSEPEEVAAKNETEDSSAR